MMNNQNNENINPLQALLNGDMKKKIQKTVLNAIEINRVDFASSTDKMGIEAAAGLVILITETGNKSIPVLFVLNYLHSRAVEIITKKDAPKSDILASKRLIELVEDYIEKDVEEYKKQKDAGESNIFSGEAKDIKNIMSQLHKMQYKDKEKMSALTSGVQDIEDMINSVKKSIPFPDIKKKREEAILRSIDGIFENTPHIKDKMIELLQEEFDDILTYDDIHKYENIQERCFDKIKQIFPDQVEMNIKKISEADIIEIIAKKHVAIHALITTRKCFIMLKNMDHMISIIDVIIFSLISDTHKEMSKGFPSLSRCGSNSPESKPGDSTLTSIARQMVKSGYKNIMEFINDLGIEKGEHKEFFDSSIKEIMDYFKDITD